MRIYAIQMGMYFQKLTRIYTPTHIVTTSDGVEPSCAFNTISSEDVSNFRGDSAIYPCKRLLSTSPMGQFSS